MMHTLARSRISFARVCRTSRAVPRRSATQRLALNARRFTKQAHSSSSFLLSSPFQPASPRATLVIQSRRWFASSPPPYRRVISFTYTLRNTAGEVLDESGETPLSFLEGSDHIIPGLESKLVTMGPGDAQKIFVPFAEAYGPRDDSKLVKVARTQFKTEVEVKLGDQFQNSNQPGVPLTVVQMDETHIILDGNSPLAGIDLVFDVQITGIRKASDEEVSHGHAHEPGHHHH